MEFDKKDNELIEMIADYFKEKYGTSIVVVFNGDKMNFSGRRYSANQAMAVGASIVKSELQDVLNSDDEEETEIPLIEKILKVIGKED